MCAFPEVPPVSNAEPLSMNDKGVGRLSEMGILTECACLGGDVEYQSTPSKRFETVIVAPSGCKSDRPLGVW